MSMFFWGKPEGQPSFWGSNSKKRCRFLPLQVPSFERTRSAVQPGCSLVTYRSVAVSLWGLQPGSSRKWVHPKTNPTQGHPLKGCNMEVKRGTIPQVGNQTLQKTPPKNTKTNPPKDPQMVTYKVGVSSWRAPPPGQQVGEEKTPKLWCPDRSSCDRFCSMHKNPKQSSQSD